MTTAMKIEIIVTTVAKFYGLKWQLLFGKSHTLQREKANMYRLIREHISPNEGHEFMNVRLQAFRSCMYSNPPDDLFKRISDKVSEQLTETISSQKIAS